MSGDNKEEKKKDSPLTIIAADLSSAEASTLENFLKHELKNKSPHQIVIPPGVEKLQGVEIRGLQLTPIACRSLSSILPSCIGLNTFVLRSCEINEDSLTMLIGILSKYPHLHTLRLDTIKILPLEFLAENYSTKFGGLLNAGPTVPLGFLTKDYSAAFGEERRIDDKWTWKSADLFRQYHQLQILDLHNNQIGDLGFIALVDALRAHPTLHTLELSDNRITDAGLQHLALNLPSWRALRVLDLCNDDSYSEKGLQAISRILPDISLKNLKILYGYDCVAETAKVTYVNIIRAFVDTLYFNTSLIELGYIHDLGLQGYTSIALCLARNRKIQQMWMQENQNPMAKFLDDFIFLLIPPSLPIDLVIIIAAYIDDVGLLKSVEKFLQAKQGERLPILAKEHEKQLSVILQTYISDGSSRIKPADFFMELMKWLLVSDTPHQWQLVRDQENVYSVAFSSLDVTHMCHHYLCHLFGGAYPSDCDINWREDKDKMGVITIQITPQALRKTAITLLELLTQERRLAYNAGRSDEGQHSSPLQYKGSAEDGKLEVKRIIPVARPKWGSSFASSASSSAVTVATTSTPVQTTSTSSQSSSSDKEEPVKKEDDACLVM